MKKGFKKPALWVNCLLASLLLHTGALLFFAKSPISFSGKTLALFHNSKPFPLPLKAENKEQEVEDSLESFFEEFVVTAPQTPKAEEIAVTARPLLLEASKNSHPLPEQNLSPLESASPTTPSHLFTSPIEEDIPMELSSNILKTAPASFCETPDPSFSSPKSIIGFDETNIAPPLLEDSFAKELESSSNLGLPTKRSPNKGLPTIGVNAPPALEKEAKIPVQERSFEASTTDFAAAPQNIGNTCPVTSQGAHDLLSGSSFADIEEYFPNEALYSLAWSGAFTVSPSFFPEDDGYVFALQITPKEELLEQKQKQTVLFLVDTSSKIEKHKVSVFKRSTLKALAALQPGDDFNIYLLDEENHSFKPHPVPFSAKTLKLAEEFLEQKFDKPFFASFDLFDSLSSVIEEIDDNGEIYTAVLLTNGKVSSSAKQEQAALAGLLHKNRGKLSLFSAAVGKNNNLVTLDMLSTLSGGKLLYSNTNASFPRKLATFVKTMQSPLIKDVGIAIHTNDPKANISLEPLVKKNPNLYLQEPFLVMGKMDRLGPLLLTLEGRNEEGWVLANEEIDFERAEPASASLKREWRQRKVSALYGEFLRDAKTAHLEEAKELLKVSYGKACGE